MIEEMWASNNSGMQQRREQNIICNITNTAQYLTHVCHMGQVGYLYKCDQKL